MTVMRFLRAFAAVVIETYRQLASSVGAPTSERFARAFALVIDIVLARPHGVTTGGQQHAP